MGLAQKWLLGLMGLGALGMVLANPNAFYTGAKAIRSVTAGSIADVTSGGKAHTQY